MLQFRKRSYGLLAICFGVAFFSGAIFVFFLFDKIIENRLPKVCELTKRLHFKKRQLSLSIFTIVDNEFATLGQRTAYLFKCTFSVDFQNLCF